MCLTQASNQLTINSCIHIECWMFHDHGWFCCAIVDVQTCYIVHEILFWQDQRINVDHRNVFIEFRQKKEKTLRIQETFETVSKILIAFSRWNRWAKKTRVYNLITKLSTEQNEPTSSLSLTLLGAKYVSKLKNEHTHTCSEIMCSNGNRWISGRIFTSTLKHKQWYEVIRFNSIRWNSD